MLFGFRGHWNGVIDTTANGEVSAGLRQMRVSMASPDVFSGAVDIVPFYYEADVNSGGTPLNISLNGTFVSAVTTTNRSGFIREAAYSLPTNGYDLATIGGRTFGAQYLNPISPLTRRNRFNISRPDLVEGISITVITNNAGKTNTSNHQRDINFDDYSKFTHLKFLSLDEGYISGMTGNLPSSLEYLRIGEQPVLYNIPKINNGLKHFIINETIVPTSAITYSLSGVSTLEILNFIRFSPYPTIAANTQPLSGNMDLSSLASLKNLYILNKSSGNLSLYNNYNQWIDFYIRNSMYTDSGYINNVLSGSTGLTSMIVDRNILSWNKNINNDDIQNSLQYLYLYNTSTTGSCIISSNKPNLIDFRLGNSSTSNRNNFDLINLSGATNLQYVDIVGCNTTYFTPPISSGMTDLLISNNNISITNNPNIYNIINQNRNITTLEFGVISTREQNSTGLGNNPILTGLTKLQMLSFEGCKISGTLFLPSSNTLTQLLIGNNTGLTNVSNINFHTNLDSIRIQTTATNIDYYNLNMLRTYLCSNNTGQVLVNLSGRTSAASIVISFNFFENNILRDIIFPILSGGSLQLTSNNDINIYSCPILSGLTNQENITFTNSGSSFNAYSCNLNQDIKFGYNTFLPYQMLIQNNNMNQSNVDANINSIYLNRVKWNGYASKILNISGTNSAPSGIYQAPVGFVLNVSDGTPASANEQVYVLVNNYGFTITTT